MTLAMTYWQTAAVLGLWLWAVVMLISLATVWIEWWDGQRAMTALLVVAACLVLVLVVAVASAAIVLRQDWS